MSSLEIVSHGEVEQPSRLEKVAHTLFRVITLQGFAPEAAPLHMSEHYHMEDFNSDAA